MARGMLKVELETLGQWLGLQSKGLSIRQCPSVSDGMMPLGDPIILILEGPDNVIPPVPKGEVLPTLAIAFSSPSPEMKVDSIGVIQTQRTS